VAVASLLKLVEEDELFGHNLKLGITILNVQEPLLMDCVKLFPQQRWLFFMISVQILFALDVIEVHLIRGCYY
jgi:hypothetical protein